MKENEFFKNQEVEEFDLTDKFEDEAFEAKELGLESSKILRIEEKVFHSWGGVKSCGHTTRIKNECSNAVNNWAKNKIFEYRQYRWVRYGSESSKVHVTNRKDPWTGKRSCGARTTIPCYIEFRKP